jgi:hypothetical protein
MKHFTRAIYNLPVSIPEKIIPLGINLRYAALIV